MKPYDPKKIEPKWQKKWEKEEPFKAKTGSKKPKYYALIEFPYPSGDGLHVGHPRPYIGMDVIARKRRAQGFNVLYPIGWDAFGLPTENYAIKTGKDPRIVTKENTKTFKRQIQSLGISFDWSRELNTTDPKYYKWTQWIFLQFLKAGLAYKAKATINWCPKDKIGLANEEVVNGRCERCGTLVEKREKEQWMLAITKYADRLDKDLDTVDYLPQIKQQQKNWIGKSEGVEINFAVDKHDITVFTTRPDTIFGATFIAVSPEVAKTWLDIGWPASDEIKKYIGRTLKEEMKDGFEEKKKSGIYTGFGAINPATKGAIPVWIVNYVMGDVGTGAIMGVPAHDERDNEFATKYNLPVEKVIEPCFFQTTEPGKIVASKPFVERNAIMAIVKHWSEDKYIGLQWKKVEWKTLITGGVESNQTPEEAAIAEIREETGYLNPKLIRNLGIVHSKFYHVPKKENRFGHFHVLYFELQDGENNIISDKENEIHELKWLSKDEMGKFLTPESHIYSWKLFRDNSNIYTGRGVLVNSGKFSGMDSETAKAEIAKFLKAKKVTKYKLRDWIFSRQRYWGEPIPVIHCSQCGIVPVPDKDLPVLLPPVKDFMPTDSGESPLANISKWVNVKCPKCAGPAKRETDVMPNWAGSSWYFLRYADPENAKEFAGKSALTYWMPVDWYNGGMEHTTLHLLYSRFWNKFLFDKGLVPTSEPYKKRTSHGLILAEGGEKMSKSKGNVINPDDIVKTYGADTLRVYEMFMGPFDQAIAWSTESIIGPRRFLEKVWRLSGKLTAESGKHTTSDEAIEVLLHKTIKKVSDDIEAMHFNTAISSLMIFINECERAEAIPHSVFATFLKLLAPFAPHIAEELWETIGETNSVHTESWPAYDRKKLLAETMRIAVQINGKVRATLDISAHAPEKEITAEALKLPAVKKWMGENSVKKIVYIKGRLISIVV